MYKTDEGSTPPPPLPPPPCLYDRPQENSHQINQINHSDFLILAFALLVVELQNLPVFGVGSYYFGFSFSTLSQNMLHNIRSQNTQQS